MHNKFESFYQEFIYKRTYSRWDWDKGRRENWNETVNRYYDYLKPRVPSKLIHTYEYGRDLILQRKVLPSMRALWTAGSALDSDNICAYNCAYTTISYPKVFADILYVLLNGTGMGYSVERQYIAQLPNIPSTLQHIDRVIVVEDSKLGWAEALNQLINLLYEGYIPKYDLSKVRPAGSILKTFGGRSSGPLPLKRLFDYTIKVFESARGRKLNSIECHDLACVIAECVVVGGVRRSSLLSLSNLSDQRMKRAKEGSFWETNPQRMMANNSTCYTEKPDMKIFMEEWLSLATSGTGERGIFNRDSCNNLLKGGRRDLSYEFGCNPCQPADALLLDGEYLQEIQKGGTKWASWKTGVKEVLELTLNNGMKVRFTPEHKIMLDDGSWCEAKNTLEKSIKWGLGNRNEERLISTGYLTLGFLFGDGSRCASGEGITVNLNKEKEPEVYSLLINSGFKEEKCGSLYINRAKYGYNTDFLNHKTFEREFPKDILFSHSYDTASFLQGLFEANGSVNAHGQISLKGTNKSMIETVQLILASFGIPSWIVTNKATKIKWSNGEYVSKESYNLQIAPRNALLFKEKIGFLSDRKQNKIKKFDKEYTIKLKVVDIKSLGEMEVWDYKMSKEPHYNFCQGIIAHNCSEIILRPMEFCNLTSVVVKPEDSLNMLIKKVKVATMLGVLQSTLTDFNFIDSAWKANCEEERLLGVSMTGTCDHPVLSSVNDEKRLSDWLTTLKQTAVDAATKWSTVLGINMPTAITCCKPEGTSSQLTNTSSGIHTRYSPYYIRRVRVAKMDPIAQFLIDKGFPYNPEIGQNMDNATVYVFDFPIKSPDKAITRFDRTAIQQLEYWKAYQLFYTEHKPSFTCFVSDEFWLDVGAWVYRNWDIVSGVSFLPENSGIYQLAPYEDITEQQFKEMSSTIPKINFDELTKYESSDYTTGASEFACDSGSCMLS